MHRLQGTESHKNYSIDNHWLNLEATSNFGWYRQLSRVAAYGRQPCYAISLPLIHAQWEGELIQI